MQPIKGKLIFGAGLLGVILTIAGCGGGGSSGNGSAANGGGPAAPSSSSLAGTAAVGAAIQTGTVTAECADGSGFTSTVTTNADGTWSGNVGNASLPCVLTVTGGTPPVTLRSYASQPGTINITPITDMVLALTTGLADGSWIATPANWPDSSTIASKKTELLAAMTNAGFTLPGGDPFSTALVIGDAWDQVLDAIQEAIDDDPSIADYSALLNLVKDGNLNQFPDAPEDEEPVDPELPANLDVLTDYAGTYTVIGSGERDPGYCASCGTATRDHERGTVTISPQGDIDFDTGISFTVDDIVEIYDRKTVDADRRVAVNYGQSDSDERVRLYLNTDLEVMEIIHDDGAGATTRALIQEESTDPEPEPGAELLDMRNGVAIVHDGKMWAMEQPFIESFMATTAKRQIRAHNYDSDFNTIDTKPFNGDDLIWAQVNVAHGMLGTQLCGTSTGVSLLTVDYASAPPVQKTWTATECELDVDYHFSNGATEGHIISATLGNDKDDEQITLSGGQFRIYIHTGTEGEAPALADEIRWDMTIDSGTREMRSGHFLGGRPLLDGSHPDHALKFELQAGSNNNPAAGEYSCEDGDTEVTLKMGWITVSDPLFKFQSANGGNCTVTIEQNAGRKYLGSYTATLLGPSNGGGAAFGSGLATGDIELPAAERTLVVHGKFRNFTTQTFHAGNNGDDGVLGSEVEGVSMTIDDGSTHFVAGERFLLESEVSSNGSNGYFFRQFDDLEFPNNQMRMVWSNIPMQVGSFTCNTEVGGLKPTMTISTPADIPYGATYTQSGIQNLSEGASCTINVTSVSDGLVEGTYIATLVARNMGPVLPDNDNSISLSGEFRYPYTP
ncbi:hypothetical protein [Alcanivorax sp.]|uniref:hypothetical protein n=2 Tax=unclassified Alcanivorax TaxID=2638842 RepID=UPI002355DD7C|nr:hypothetical protein [Alcanivorax sp.]